MKQKKNFKNSKDNIHSFKFENRPIWCNNKYNSIIWSLLV